MSVLEDKQVANWVEKKKYELKMLEFKRFSQH